MVFVHLAFAHVWSRLSTDLLNFPHLKRKKMPRCKTLNWLNVDEEKFVLFFAHDDKVMVHHVVYSSNFWLTRRDGFADSVWQDQILPLIKK